MNSLVRTLTVAGVMILCIARLVPAQSYSNGPSSSTPAASQAVEPTPAMPAPFDVAATPDQYEMAVARDQQYSTNFRRSRSRSGSDRQIFVVPAAEIDRESHLAIERDIQVMSHIFDRILRKPVNRLGGVFTVMDDFFGRDSRVTQVIYLEGYGVVFLMDVDFVLVGPPEAPQKAEPNEPREQVDTTWKQAERELYAPPGISAYKAMKGPSDVKYDAEKVELLKKNLVETLKHAANIRALKSDESVVLMIVGRVLSPAGVVVRGEHVQWTYRYGRWTPASGADATVETYVSPPPSVLTIRAKKSDIDAFSKGEFDFTAFSAKTQIRANWSGSDGAGFDGGYRMQAAYP